MHSSKVKKLETVSSIKAISDAELVSRFRETGNNVFVGELYQRYSHLVYGVCMKYLQNPEDSRDATVEIFEKLLDDLKKHEIENFKPWLYSVAKNHCLMKFRKDKSRIENRPELQEDLVTVMEWNSELHLDGGNERERELVKLEEAIKQLNEGQRICIELFYLQDKSYQQIMEQTGYDFRQVKSFIQNGKRNLKIYLSGAYERKT